MANYITTQQVPKGEYRIQNNTVYKVFEIAQHGGAILCSRTAGLVNGGASFEQNTADAGGAIYINDGAKVEVADLSFVGNTADEGGAVYVSGTGNPIVFYDCTFYKNHAAENGGALYVKGNVELVNATFNGNDAKAGGAIYNLGMTSFSGDLVLSTGNDVVYNAQGATLAWNLATDARQATFGDYELLKNDNGTLAITIDDSIVAGKYVLARNVQDTAGKDLFAVMMGDSTVTTLKIDGEVQLSFVTFQLECNDDHELVLTVKSDKSLVIDNDSVTTEENLMIFREWITIQNGSSLTAGDDSTISTDRMDVVNNSLIDASHGAVCAKTLVFSGGTNTVYGVIDGISRVQIAEDTAVSINLNQFGLFAKASCKSNGHLFVYGEGSKLTQEEMLYATRLGGVNIIDFDGALNGFRQLSFGTASCSNIYFAGGYASDQKDTMAFESQVHVSIGKKGTTLDFGSGADRIDVKANAFAEISSNVENVSTIDIAAGKKVKSGSTTVQEYTRAGFADIAFDAFNNGVLTIRDYADVEVGGAVSGYTAKKNNISVGKNSSFYAQQLVNVNQLSSSNGVMYKPVLGSDNEQGFITVAITDYINNSKRNDASSFSFGKYNEVILGSVLFGAKNDTMKLGDYSTLVAKGTVDFGDGTDTLQIDTRSSAEFAEIANLDKLTINNGNDLSRSAVKVNGDLSMSNSNDTLSIGKYAAFKVAGKTDLSAGNDKFSIAANATVVMDVVDFGMGSDTLSIAAGAFVSAQSIGNLEKVSISNCKADTASTLNIQESLSFADSAKLTVGNYAQVAIGGEMFFENNSATLQVGQYALFSSGDIACIGEKSALTISTNTASQVSMGAIDAVTEVAGDKAGLKKLSVASGSYNKKTGVVSISSFAASGNVRLVASATISVGNYADVNIAGLTVLGKNTMIKIGNYSSLTLKCDNAANLKSLSAGKASTLYLSSEIYFWSDPSKFGDCTLAFDIGEYDTVARYFTSFEEENSDNDFLHSRVIEGTYQGWLESANDLDLVDFIEINGEKQLECSGTENLKVLLWSDNEKFVEWQEGMDVSSYKAVSVALASDKGPAASYKLTLLA